MARTFASPPTLPYFAHRLMARFGLEKAGMAAIEFAYILPVLSFMFFGMVELGRALDINRHYNLVTSSVADLTAREQSVQTSDLDGIMQSAAAIMQPYSIVSGTQAQTPLLKMSIFQVSADPTNVANTKVTWSYAYNGGVGTVPARCSAYTLQGGIISAGGSVIMVKASYDFAPLFTSASDPVLAATWTTQASNSPRNSCVLFGTQTSCVLTDPANCP